MADPRDFMSADEWLAASREAAEQKKQRSTFKTIIYVVLGVALFAGLGLVIWRLMATMKRKRKSQHHLAPPEPHVVNMGIPRESMTEHHSASWTASQIEQAKAAEADAVRHRDAAELKALKLWTADQLEYMQVMDSDSMSRLFVETIDQTSLEIRRNHGKLQILAMPGDSPECPCRATRASIIIMIYQDKCSSCHAAAPLYSSAAKIVAGMHRDNPSLGLLKFGVIDYHDLPVYIANHVPKETPAFLIYDATTDVVEVADISDLATLAEQITGHYKYKLSVQ